MLRIKNLLVLAYIPAMTAMASGESVFLRKILEYPRLEQPENPQVMIFTESGKDGGREGFRSGGKMEVEHWRQVFEHVGFLSAYSHFKGDGTMSWDFEERDIGVMAAVAAKRRYIGGCAMGHSYPRDINAEVFRKQYAAPIAQHMTHYFHDYEMGFGSVGGKGKYYLLYRTANGSQLASGYSKDFEFGLDKPLEGFHITMDLFLENYVYGGSGSMRLLAFEDEDGERKNDFVISIAKVGEATPLLGYTGYTDIVISDINGTRMIVPFNPDAGRAWCRLDLKGRPAVNNLTEIEVLVDGKPQGRTLINTPRPGIRRLTLGDGEKLAGGRRPCFDDVVISGIKDDQTTLLASYQAETENAQPIRARRVSALDDSSGRGNVLKPLGDRHGWEYQTSDGIERGMLDKSKLYLVDELLSARAKAGLPHPEMIANWRIGEVAGVFKAWDGYGVGLTHPSVVYYHSGTCDKYFRQLYNILKFRYGRELWQDGYPWHHAWIGVFRCYDALTPEQWETFITLAALNGTRWFSMFPAQSNGNLGSRTWPTNSTQIPEYNADCLYAVARAASRFEGGKSPFSETRLTELQVNGDFDGEVIARQHPKTGEIWFSAWRPGKTVDIELPMTADKGTVKNLVTGKFQRIDQGKFKTTAGAVAELFLFQPDVN